MSLFVRGETDRLGLDRRERYPASTSGRPLRRRQTGLRRASATCLAIALACGSPDGESRQRDVVEPDPAGAARERLGIVFDPLRVSPGDSVGVHEVARTDVRRTAVDSTAVGTISFRGAMALEGRRIRHFDVDVAATSVCFEADSVSAMRLPRWRGDRRRPWFCFDNRLAADSVLGVSVDSAAVVRIVIDEFTIHRGLSDEVNSARLVCRGFASSCRTRPSR